jgi:hypothetical protein
MDRSELLGKVEGPTDQFVQSIRIDTLAQRRKLSWIKPFLVSNSLDYLRDHWSIRRPQAQANQLTFRVENPIESQKTQQGRFR